MKRLSTTLVVIFCAVLTSWSQSNLSALMPMPNHIESTGGKPFKIKQTTTISINSPQLRFAAEQLQKHLLQRTGLTIGITTELASNQIRLTMTESTVDDGSQLLPDRYSLSVDRHAINMEGTHAGSLLYAVTTFDQLMQGDAQNTSSAQIAPVYINDSPRFDFRALMIDPARNFLPVDDVKFYIDQMARYKFNVLQIHLTDDQGWRIEIKKHPELTDIGACRNPNRKAGAPDNGFYTQQQIKELVDYAARRNVMIVPEIDIPGHTAAILKAYPALGCDNHADSPIEFGQTVNRMLCVSKTGVDEIMDDIITEIAALFPSPYIHLGGDEAAIENNWDKCESCRALMSERGYTKTSNLMIDFFDSVFVSVKRNNKLPVMWCELDNIRMPAKEYLFPYPDNALLVTWRNGLTPKCMELTKESKNRLVMAPGEFCYLDYPQYKGDLPEFNNWGMPTTTLQKCYEFDPKYGTDNANIYGVMATLWGEAIRDVNRLCYMTFPRAMAISEAAWTQMESRNWDSFVWRLYPNMTTLMQNGVSARIPFEIVR